MASRRPVQIRLEQCRRRVDDIHSTDHLAHRRPRRDVEPLLPAPATDSEAGATVGGDSVREGFSFTFLDRTLRAGAATDGQGAPPLPDTGPFVLRRLIGQGGQGEVWEAWQASLDREVAVKIHRRGDPGAFLDEAMLTAGLDHPNIVPVLDLGSLGGPEDTSTPVMAMKRVRGVRWDELISLERDPGFVPGHEYWARHLGILRSVCNAVAYAHSRGILHLDLKPSQVIVGEFGEVYLMDWGIAARFDDRSYRGRHVDRIAGPLGTPGYMAPEQALGDAMSIGIPTDVYLLGAMAYHLAMGHAPHPGLSTGDLISNARQNTIVPLHETLPAPFAAIVSRAMSTQPSARHASVEEFRAAIDAFLGEATYRREAEALLAACRVDAAGLGGLDYDALTDLERRLDRTQVLAPDLAGVDALRDEVLAAHARKAVQKGDLELARLLAYRVRTSGLRDAAVRAVESSLAERQARERQRILARRLALVALAALVVVLGVSSYSLLRARNVAVGERERAEQALEQSLRDVARASLKAAAADLQRSRPTAAREALVRTPAHLRGWEWGYLASGAAPEVRLLRPRSETYLDLAMSADESILAARRDGDGALVVLDPQDSGTGALVDNSTAWQCLEPYGESGIVAGGEDGRVAYFGRSGKERDISLGEASVRLLANDEAGRVVAADASGRVWCIDADGPPRELWQAPAGITALEARGEAIAIGTEDGRIWHTADAAQSPPVASRELHRAGVSGLAWQPDGGLIASWAIDASLQQPTSDPRLILHEPGNPAPSFVGTGDGFAVTAVSWTPDGQTLLVATSSIELYLMSPAGEVRSSMNLSIGIMNAVQATESGLLATQTRQRVEVYNLRTRGLRRSMAVDSRRVLDWAVGRQGIYVCGRDGGLGEWRWDRPEHQRYLSLYPDRVLSVDIAARAPRMATAHQIGFVGVWQLDAERHQRVAEIWMEGVVNQVCIDDEARSIAALVDNEEIRFIDHFSPGDAAQRRWPLDKPATAIALAADGRTTIASQAKGGLVRGDGLVDQPFVPVGDPTVVYGVLEFAPDGSLLAARPDGRVDVLAPDTLSVERQFAGHTQAVRSISFPSEGGLLLTASEDETAVLWRWADSQRLAVFRGTHAGPVNDALMTPDGRRVITACADSSVRVFDRETQVELFNNEIHNYGVLALEYVARGDYLISSGQDGRLRWWVPVPWDRGDLVLDAPPPRPLIVTARPITGS